MNVPALGAVDAFRVAVLGADFARFFRLARKASMRLIVGGATCLARRKVPTHKTPAIPTAALQEPCRLNTDLLAKSRDSM